MKTIMQYPENKRAGDGAEAGSKDTRPRDKNDQLINVCQTCILEAEGRCKNPCFFSKMAQEALSRKGE